MTIRQMQYFEALAETRHFGRAAEMAGVTQPALSAQIAEMEERLSCKLFERGGRDVKLTEEAHMMRPRIERILAEIRDLEAAARKGRDAMVGRFRLGIIPTVAPYFLPRILPALKARFPELQPEVREAVTGTLVEETMAGRLDGFVAAMPVSHPGLLSQILFEDRFMLAVPADDDGFVAPPVAPESPALERLMLLEEGHCMREQALVLCGSVRPSTLASYGATSLATLLQMVSHGLGLTLIPEMALTAGPALPGIKVVPFAEPQPVRQICLAWRRRSLRHEECLTLSRLLADLAPVRVAGMEKHPHPLPTRGRVRVGV